MEHRGGVDGRPRPERCLISSDHRLVEAWFFVGNWAWMPSSRSLRLPRRLRAVIPPVRGPPILHPLTRKHTPRLSQSVTRSFPLVLSAASLGGKGTAQGPEGGAGLSTASRGYSGEAPCAPFATTPHLGREIPGSGEGLACYARGVGLEPSGEPLPREVVPKGPPEATFPGWIPTQGLETLKCRCLGRRRSELLG